MSYRYVYPSCAQGVSGAPVTGYGGAPGVMAAGYPNGAGTNLYAGNHRRGSYSPGSFSSDSDSMDDYEYRGRIITRETRCPRDVVRAPTPPPIIKRVVERAPTPEPPVMERVIIRPQPQEIVERVIEQPRTPPPRIIQKEMCEEAPPPIVRTRVIKVDRPLRSGYSQPGSPFCFPGNGLQTFSNGAMGGGQAYRTHSIAGSVGQPMAFANPADMHGSFSSGGSFDCAPPAIPAGHPMMMMQHTHQVQPVGAMPQQQMQTMGMMQQQQQQQHQHQHQMQPMSIMPQQTMSALSGMPQQVQGMSVMPQQVQPVGVMQQQQQQQPQQTVQQQMMYRPVQMQQSIPQMTPQPIPPLPSNYMSQGYMFPGQQGMSFGYHPMMHQGGVIPSGMPMPTGGNTFLPQAGAFASQPMMFKPMAQQVVY